MKHVRPFDPAALAPGEQRMLLAAEEGLDCAVAIRRGGGAPEEARAAEDERFALVLQGEVALNGGERAGPGDLVVLPAGAAGAVGGGPDAVWIDIAGSLPAGAAPASAPARIVRVDPSRFEGTGFAHQSLADRCDGAESMRLNTLQVQPGSGSPDYHIHMFGQIYVILEGEMTIDIGRRRMKAPANSVVVLPPGVAHRNFNASAGVERHVSLLVPEPHEGEIFDYAVTIHEHEAELMTDVPA